MSNLKWIDALIKEVGSKFIALPDDTIIYNHQVADCYHTELNGYSIYVCTVGEYRDRLINNQSSSGGKTTKPAKIGNTIFKSGVSISTVIKRAYKEFERHDN